eukprot:3128252-Prymnesium_polylepis.1
MQDDAHRQCAGDALCGISLQSVCKPLTHTVPTRVGMRSLRSRKTPPRPLTWTFTIDLDFWPCTVSFVSTLGVWFSAKCGSVLLVALLEGFPECLPENENESSAPSCGRFEGVLGSCT